MKIVTNKIMIGLIILLVFMFTYAQEYPDNCNVNDDMKVDGDIVVGTSTPTNKLTVLPDGAGDGIVVRETDNGNNGVLLQGFSTKGRIVIYNAGESNILLDPGADSYFTDGNLGVGTIAPYAKLEVEADWQDSLGSAAITAKGDAATIMLHNTTNNEKWLFKTEYAWDGGLQFCNDTATNGLGSREKFVMRTDGDFQIYYSGGGIILTSPNGSVTKKLSIDNNGDLVLESP